MAKKKKHSKINVVNKDDGYRKETVTTYHLSNGKLHRIDGPAKIIENKTSNYITYRWYRNGRLHRLDGPAIYDDIPDDNRWVGYYYKGKLVTKDELKKYNRNSKLRQLGI